MCASQQPELSLNTKLLSHFLGVSFPFWIYSCDHSWKHAGISKYFHLMKQKYTWRPWNVFFPNKKDCQNDIHIHHTHPTYLDLNGILIHCIYTYIDIVLECFGSIPHSFKNSFWFGKSLLISDLRCNDPASDGSRNPSKAQRWRWGNIYIYIFVYDFYVFIQSSFWQACFLFENTCSMHFVFCPKLCSKSVQRPLRAALWTAQCPSRFAGQGC